MNFGAAIELPRMAQHHPIAAMHWLHNPARLHICIAKLSQFANFHAILTQANDRESSISIRRIRRAHIENVVPSASSTTSYTCALKHTSLFAAESTSYIQIDGEKPIIVELRTTRVLPAPPIKSRVISEQVQEVP